MGYGLFVSDKFAKEVKEFIDKKLTKEKCEALDRLMKFAVTLEIENKAYFYNHVIDTVLTIFLLYV